MVADAFGEVSEAAGDLAEAVAQEDAAQERERPSAEESFGRRAHGAA